MKKEILAKFENFFSGEKPQVPQYINYLLKNLNDRDFLNKVVEQFPIYKKSNQFWNNKFWYRKIIDFLTQLNTRNFDAVVKSYFKQNKCYNKQLLQYSFEKNADKTIEILIESNALNEPTHLRSLICADQFELIFSKFPQDLINGLRTTQLFLEPKVWEKIEDVLRVEKGEFFDCYLTFKDLKETNQSYEDQIEEYSELFNDPVKLLCHLSLSHERNIFLNKNHELIPTNFEVAINSIYNFVSFRCNCGKFNYDSIGSSDLQKRIFSNVKEQEEYNRLFVLLFQFLEFRSNVLEFFCFDKNAKPVRDKDTNLILKPQDESKELLWVKNGNKYEYWNSYYILKGRDLTLDLVNSNPNFRATCNSEVQFINQANFLTAQYRDKLFYEDLNLSNYKLKDNISICHIVNTLEALKENMIVAELNCKENFMSESENFEHYRNKLKKLNLDNSFVRIEKYNDLVNMCRALNKVSEDVAHSIIDFHTTNLQNNKSKQLDQKPIVRIGEICLILPWFMKLISPHITTLNNLIQNAGLNEDFGKLIEKKLVHEFKKNFTAKSFKQVNKEGDYDCLVYKDGVLFVIQTKATHIRASLKDNFLFTEREINKAKHQIDKNLIDLHENFESIRDRLGIKETSIDELQIFPLIVTTSFEKDGETLISSFDPKYKIHKISLFELQIILRGEEQNMFDYNEVFFNQAVKYKQGKRRCSAQEFIAMIQTNQVWAKIDASPISINEKYYTISNSTANQLCDESIRELRKGNVDNALLLISEAIKQNSSNAKFYCHFGDINSELGQLDFAIECYTKSIKLNTEFVDAYYNLSQIYLKQNNLFPAYACLTKVLELNPSDNDARVNLNAIESDILKQPDLMNKIKEFLTQ